MPKLCGFTRYGRSHSGGEEAEPGCRVNFFVLAASAMAGAISSMHAKGLPRQDFQIHVTKAFWFIVSIDGDDCDKITRRDG